jgi:hypothetical protein
MHSRIGHAFFRSCFRLVFAAVSLCAFSCFASEPPPAQPAVTTQSLAQIRLPDLAGKMVAPFVRQQGRAFVLLFIRTDCPISNRYAPEMRRLAAKYSKQGVTFWLVYPDETVTVQEIRQHLADYELPLAALRDPTHALVGLTGVNVTPEAVVFTSDGTRVYRGRIDDRFVDFGKEHPAATEHDLESALQAVLAGKPVAKPETKAIGCYISGTP